MIKDRIFTVSNFISFIRLLLVVPLWIMLDHIEDQSFRYYSAALCLFASFTDILDGYLARKLNQISELGKIIDPLSDKVLIAVIVLKLFLIGEIQPYYFFLIIGRDTLILIGGLIVAKKSGKVLPSDKIGKATVIVFSLLLLMIILNLSRNTFYFQIFFYGSIVLIFVSFFNYAFKAIKTYNQTK